MAAKYPEKRTEQGRKIHSRRKTRRSFEWFVNYIKKSRKESGMKGSGQSKAPVIGGLYVFTYDAKYKDSLPIWDQYPLILCFNRDATHFWGINFHYIRPNLRAKIIDVLSDKHLTGKGEKRRLQITYKKLIAISQSKYVKDATKQYLYSHLKTVPMRIPYSEWEYSVELRMEKWHGPSGGKYKTPYSRSKR